MHGLATCLQTVVEVNKGMLPVRHFCSNKLSFLCQLNFMKIERLLQGLGEFGHSQSREYFQI